MMEILQNFVAFSEYMNFNLNFILDKKMPAKIMRSNLSMNSIVEKNHALHMYTSVFAERRILFDDVVGRQVSKSYSALHRWRTVVA